MNIVDSDVEPLKNTCSLIRLVGMYWPFKNNELVNPV